MELIIGVVIIVGAIYYYTVGKNKEFAPVVPPEEILPTTPGVQAGI